LGSVDHRSNERDLRDVKKDLVIAKKQMNSPEDPENPKTPAEKDFELYEAKIVVQDFSKMTKNSKKTVELYRTRLDEIHTDSNYDGDID
jgi:hypothetical protein